MHSSFADAQRFTSQACCDTRNVWRARSYLKINTMFGVAKAHGLTTTWSDKASGYVVRAPQPRMSVPRMSTA